MQDVPFELQSLAKAKRYQAWLRDRTLPYLGNRILELGSGLGTMSQHLPVRERLILSDVDSHFIATLEKRFLPHPKISVLSLPAGASLGSLENENIDTVVSYNVLEHVENDSELLGQLIALLKKSNASGPKRIVSLVPAHQWAFGPIDEGFGHFRRYSKKSFSETLQRAGVKNLSAKNFQAKYMNVLALIGWWINGKVLGKEKIGQENVQAFEALCPLIRPVDDFLQKWIGLPCGNSLVAVYTIDEK